MAKYLNVQEAADELGVSRTTMSQFLRDGRVRAARLANEGDGDSRGDRWLIRSPVQLKESGWLTLPQVASLLGVSRARAWQLVDAGALKAVRAPGARWWKVSRAAVAAYQRRKAGNGEVPKA